MASKKRGRPKKKASKRVAVTTTTKQRKKRTKRTAVIAVPKASMSEELTLLNKIDRKVNRIDQTVNAGFHLARKAKHAQRRHAFSHAFDEAEREGITAE
jgi:hypothetical protein